jgi:hypothetical protein
MKQQQDRQGLVLLFFRRAKILAVCVATLCAAQRAALGTLQRATAK